MPLPQPVVDVNEAGLGTCRSCGASVQWAFSQAGNRIPLDLARLVPGNPGALVLQGDQAWSYRAAVEALAGCYGMSQDEAVAQVLLMNAYRAHFDTCDASQIRPRMRTRR